MPSAAQLSAERVPADVGRTSSGARSQTQISAAAARELRGWQAKMRLALGQIADAFRHSKAVGGAPETVWVHSLGNRLSREVRAPIREPRVVLREWRLLQRHREQAPEHDAARQVMAGLLHAEYAGALLVQPQDARELPGGLRTPLAARVLLHDRRAAETADELVGALWSQASASARAALYTPGTPEHLEAERELEQLKEIIAELESALRERPWTE